MKGLFVFIFLFLSVTLFSQVVNNLVVFSSEGEKFTLTMSGEKYNNEPQTKVRVVGLTQKKYQVRIIFVNPKLKDVVTTLTFFDTGYECQFALNAYGKKKHKMEFFTQTVMEGFEKKKEEPINNVNQNNSNNETAVQPPPPPTQPSTLMTGPGMTPKSQNPVHVNPANGSIIIGSEEFSIFKSAILKQISDDAKHMKAMELLKNKSVLSSQVKESMELFSTDQAKLDFAKKAYPNTKDKENYSTLLEALKVNSLKEELKQFIAGHK